jgi:hypothetical protein
VEGCGGALFEAWNNIGGTAVSALTSDPRYQANTPDERRNLNTDASQLFLNPNGPSPAGKVMIAEETGCCRDWPMVFSNPIQLTGGNAYYIEGLFKEGGGGDYIRVAARLEGSADPLAALGPNELGRFAPPGAAGSITFTQQPADVTVPENTTASFSVGATNTHGLPQCYQWQRDSGAGFMDIPGANGLSYSLLALPADDGSRFRVAISIVGALEYSAEALLTVIPDTNAPCLVSASADITGYLSGDPHIQ